MSNLPNLNEPNQNGVGLFFAVVRSAIEGCDWKRSDFEKVGIVEGQLDALEAYFNSSKTDPDPVEKQVVKEVVAPETAKKEEIDPHDKGEKRKVGMPDSIAQIAKDMAETQKIRDNMPPPPVTEAPMPKTDQEYDAIF